MSYRYNSKINRSINSKFGTLHLYHMKMVLQTFFEDGRNSIGTRKQQQKKKDIQIHNNLWTECLVTAF